MTQRGNAHDLEHIVPPLPETAKGQTSLVPAFKKPAASAFHFLGDRHLSFIEDFSEQELPSIDSVHLEDVQWETHHVDLHIMELGCASVLAGQVYVQKCRRSKLHVTVLKHVTVVA